jgi:uncharacterized membrane protein (UPF0136 family)
MKITFAKWMIAYGIFLVLMGGAGFLSNPEKAKTALMSGGTFGGLAVVLGWLAQRGAAWPRAAALALTTMLTGVFCWRSSVSWMAFAGGQSEKLVAALLITAMGIASVAMFIIALRAGRPQLPPTTHP